LNRASRIAGEKISDCGSATWGDPAKTLCVQNGDCPECSACARNWICAWKCAFASNGIVTAPDSQGQHSATQAQQNSAAASQ
jgi:hypothetical protein